MKVGIMQPYFMPYIGYWQLIKAVDKYVVYDDVNYIKKGWINRNNILVNGNAKLFSISLKEASQNKLINEIEISDDFNKFLKTLYFCYSKAPHYKAVDELMQKICAYPNKNLGDFLYNSISEVCNYLGIETEIILSSSIEKDNSLKGQDKILHICKNLGATEYYNAIGGKELYDDKSFAANNIKLSFLRTEFQEYPQLGSPFVKGLSMIDVLMFNSVAEVNRHLDGLILEK